MAAPRPIVKHHRYLDRIWHNLYSNSIDRAQFNTCGGQALTRAFDVARYYLVTLNTSEK